MARAHTSDAVYRRTLFKLELDDKPLLPINDDGEAFITRCRVEPGRILDGPGSITLTTGVGRKTLAMLHDLEHRGHVGTIMVHFYGSANQTYSGPGSSALRLTDVNFSEMHVGPIDLNAAQPDLLLVDVTLYYNRAITIPDMSPLSQLADAAND